MHLFKNKTKDVKQFLDEMKANKTNRSSNLNSLEKRQNKIIPSSQHDQYQNSQVTSIKNPTHQNGRKLSSSIDSNKSFDMPSNQRSVNSIGHKFYPSPPQPIISHQRTSQEQMNFRTSGTRPSHNQTPQYSQSYQQHIPESLYNQHSYSNRFPAYNLTQKQMKFEQPRNINSSYHNLSQPISYHNNDNLDEFYEQKRRYDSPQNFSQLSNSTIYESPQYYQNNKMSYSTYQKPLKKTQSSHYVNQSPNQRIQRQSNQYQQRSHLTNSQQAYNRSDYHNSFVSQVSNMDYPMEEIREAEAGMSTEKDSPAKFTQYLSKDKNQKMKFIEPTMNNFAESNVIEIVHFDQIESQVKEISPKFTNSNNKLSFNKNKAQLLNEKQPTTKNPEQSKDKQLTNHSKQDQVLNKTEQKTRKTKIKFSEQQKCKLNKSLHQSYEVYLTLDGLFKETSILFSNIQRSSNEFAKKISEGGVYFKYMNPDTQKSNQKLEIQDEDKVGNLKFQQTYKKQKPEANDDIQHKMNVQRTNRRTNRNSDVQI